MAYGFLMAGQREVAIYTFLMWCLPSWHGKMPLEHFCSTSSMLSTPVAVCCAPLRFVALAGYASNEPGIKAAYGCSNIALM
jgi:hypothetical protein